jgi:hypothetical protein
MRKNEGEQRMEDTSRATEEKKEKPRLSGCRWCTEWGLLMRKYSEIWKEGISVLRGEKRDQGREGRGVREQ